MIYVGSVHAKTAIRGALSGVLGSQRVTRVLVFRWTHSASHTYMRIRIRSRMHKYFRLQVGDGWAKTVSDP
jgi:hypothetical protein